ncbi:MAG: glycine--tRNA ligase subunit beta [Candidatus Cloacimonetes bacterium]|nr:glycine--tRNA ligase subunit beta [Candidatus Cloacimonadota bacterium]
MIKKDILIEIGVEDIPAVFIANAQKFITNFIQKELKANKLTYEAIRYFSTPRRFAVIIKSLPDKQQDEIIEKVGPSLEIAYRDDELSKAGEGFLRGAKALVSDIFIKETSKGKKIAIRKNIIGKPTEEIIKNIVESLLKSISFPKSMRWNSTDFYFARPLRWIVMLSDDKVIPFKFNGLENSRETRGNRFLGLDKKISLKEIDDYEIELEKAFVIPDRAKRKSIIENQLKSLFNDSNEEIIPNERLLDIITDIVEYPTTTIANFSEPFLTLPDKIIILTLSEHQKYFAVQDKNGKLVNKFVFISNGNPVFSELIKSGNEKVISARLNDAEFFYKEDLKLPLEKYVPKLSDVLFEASLGNLLEKVNRIEKSVEFLTNSIEIKDHKINSQEKINCLRAAKLAKADLITLMLNEKEFTKLQGYIGMKYALASGENPNVATAIYEHYLPRGQNDDLPSTFAGSIVALADKMDTVCGIIGIDKLPTGSNDPFALRRATNGIIQIIFSNKFNLDLELFIKNTFTLLESKFPKKDNNLDFVINYFKQRIAWFLEQNEIQQDVIQSVIHIKFKNVLDVYQRASALQEYKTHTDFIKLITGFKRVSNIIREVKEFQDLKVDLLQEKDEIELYQQLEILFDKVKQYLNKKDYSLIFAEFVNLNEYIDNFFDNVLVNTENKNLKNNRYSLLNHIRKIFLSVADLALIVLEEKR